MKYSRTGNAVFKLVYHLVLVTKYRRKVLNTERVDYLRGIMERILEKQGVKLVELNGERDHIHILFETKPTANLANIVNNIKTVSSRMIKKVYKIEGLGKKGVFWSSSYFIMTSGGVGIKELKKYIENQDKDRPPPNPKDLEGA